MLAKNIIELIGNTPMLLIPKEVHGIANLELWAKLEHLNPFGSLKDRTAWGLLREDIESIAHDKKTIIEASSGNTAKALQCIANTYGVSTRIISSLYKVSEHKEILQLLGGNLEEVESASDCFDAEDPDDPYYLIKELVEEDPNAFYRAGQFDRSENWKIHYETTGAEIARDLKHVDYLFAGLGSTGSSYGIQRALQEANPDLNCVGVACAKNETIPGIMKKEELESAAAASMLFDSSAYDALEEVTEASALEDTLTLVKQVGLLAGPSTGANLSAVRAFFAKEGAPTKPAKAVFLACDRIEPYLSYVKQRAPEIFSSKTEGPTITAYREEGDTSPWAVAGRDFSTFVQKYDPLIIDTRSAKAAQLVPCKGAVNIPLPLFEKLVSSGKPFPIEKDLLIVCAIGEKSIHLAGYLRTKGYKAFSLEKGIRGLKMARSGFFSGASFGSSPKRSIAA